jgi:hypothetical protein
MLRAEKGDEADLHEVFSDGAMQIAGKPNAATLEK